MKPFERSRASLCRAGWRRDGNGAYFHLRVAKAICREHDPEKWQSVFRKDHAPSRNLARRKQKPRVAARGFRSYAMSD
jgi:hypothetical protein